MLLLASHVLLVQSVQLLPPLQFNVNQVSIRMVVSPTVFNATPPSLKLLSTPQLLEVLNVPSALLVLTAPTPTPIPFSALVVSLLVVVTTLANPVLSSTPTSPPTPSVQVLLIV